MKALKIYCILIFWFGCSGELIAPDGPEELPPAELADVFDVMWSPSLSFGDFDGAVPIQDGMPVQLITDPIGGYDIPYSGAAVPSVRFKTPPVFKKGNNVERDYIFFPNASDMTYGDNSTPRRKDGSLIEQPFTVYAVVRRLQAISDEGYWAQGFGFRNRGDDHYELSVNTGASDFSNGSGILDANKISIVKVLYDGSNSKLWINNEPYDGGSTVDVGTSNLKILGYSTISHIAQHDFFGMWLKFGYISQIEDEMVYKELSEYFNPGQYPDYAIADNLDIDWDGTNKSWTVTYDYISPNAGDVETDTRYQWYIRKGGQDSTLEDVYPLEGPKAQNKTLFRSDFPNDLEFPYPSMSHVYCGVQTAGTWRELHSPYEVDNIE